MIKIIKRDGTVQDFNRNKIIDAVTKAMIATGNSYDDKFPEFIANQVIECLEDDKTYTVDQIQVLVENGLMSHDCDAARAYIIYRYQRDTARNINPVALVDSYLSQADWRTKENASVSYSIGGMILNNSGAITANYWLNTIYDKEISDAHRSAAIHIHDLSMLSAYCVGHNLLELIKQGITGVPGKISSAPPKHLSTLCNQMVNFLGILQNEAAGAQAFSSFDTYLAPYIKEDNMTDSEVYQCLQSFMYGVNTPSRWGTQSPFSNITLDWICPDDLRDVNCWVGDKQVDFTYGECQDEIDLINKILIDIFMTGDAEGRGFAYPIPTYSITKDFDWSSDNARRLFEMASKYGTPYFQNFINSDLSPQDSRSMCCRLRLDLKEVIKKSGGLFGAGEQTGSIGVVTINLPQLAYRAKGDKDTFFSLLNSYMDIAAKSLRLKRKVIEKLTDQGFYPYQKHYIHTWNTFFNTIGLCGGHEACLNISNGSYGIADPEGQEFMNEVLDFMIAKSQDYQEEDSGLWNIEATPAEGTSTRLALHDSKNYPGIIQSGTSKAPYYTNSTWLPVNYTDDVFEALDIEDQFQSKYTGGTVLHAYLGSAITDWKVTADLVKSIFNNYKLPYLTISPTYSICPIHGYISGEHKFCPECKTEELIELRKQINELENANDNLD